MRAITLGKNSKGEWALIHSPDVPIGEQLASFDESNLKALPKGVTEVWFGLVEDPSIRRTLGPKGGQIEQDAARKRAEEKAAIQKRLDEANLVKLAAVDPKAAAAEIDRLKAKANPAKARKEPEPATK